MAFVRTRLNLTSLDRAFAPYIDRGQELPAPLTLLAQAHAASVDHQFTRRTGILVDGRTVPWDPPSPFGSSPIGEPLERTGRLRQSWQIGHPDNITVITPKRVERGTRVPYAALLRGGTPGTGTWRPMGRGTRGGSVWSAGDSGTQRAGRFGAVWAGGGRGVRAEVLIRQGGGAGYTTALRARSASSRS
jgi:hypothetical protein